MLQGEYVGEQVWERVVGVAHRCHEERHHPAGGDANHHNAEDDYVDHEGVLYLQYRCHKEGHHPAGEDGDKRDAGVLIMRA